MRRSGFGLGLTLALVCLWLTPAAAHATCSDYVVIGNPSEEAVRNQMTHPRGRLPSSPLSPCSRGECRSMPTGSAVPLQQVVVTPSHSDAMALLGFVTPPVLSPHSFTGREASQLRSEDHSLAPEPPPRAC